MDAMSEKKSARTRKAETSARKRQETDDLFGELTYEEAMRLLEETVTKLETGTLPLEDSLSAFDEGVRLVRSLNGRLDAMEKRMEVLLADDEGTRIAPMEDQT